jgi:hypothetical protein
MEDLSWTEMMDSSTERKRDEMIGEEWPLQNKRWELPTVPLDEEGFVVAFGVDETEKVLEFFAKYGFVVVKEVLSSEEINESIDEIWNEIEGNNR